MRLFAAVQPPLVALGHLETALTTVRGGRPEPSLRWTLPDDWHITLAFYGEAPEGYLDDVARALDDLGRTLPPFDAALRGAGLFDGRTLWVGCSDGGWGPLMTGTGRIGAEVLGRPADRRSRPHLTIARVSSRARGDVDRGARDSWDRRVRDSRDRGARDGRSSFSGEPASLAHALALYTGPTWTVGEIALMSSTLGAGLSGASRYDVVHRSPLRRRQ
jgi:2'-5' RNA ligase